MVTNDEREVIRASLRSWGKRRRSLDTERGALVRKALALDISKEEIHQSTGLGRSTIDRLQAGKEPSA